MDGVESRDWKIRELLEGGRVISWWFAQRFWFGLECFIAYLISQYTQFVR